jgi:hypothetical protein
MRELSQNASRKKNYLTPQEKNQRLTRKVQIMYHNVCMLNDNHQLGSSNLGALTKVSQPAARLYIFCNTVLHAALHAALRAFSVCVFCERF